MLSITCISDFDYFDSPDFLKHSLLIFSAISTPIYFLGVYCILCKTPKPMESVKWYLFTLHICVMTFDYSISLLTIPFLFFPQLAMISNGVLRHLGVSPVIQTVLLAVGTCNLTISILSIFESRFFILCEFRWKSKWAVLRRFWLGWHYISGPVWLVPLYFLIPEQSSAREQLFRALPCLPESLYKEEIFVFALNVEIKLSTFLLVVAFVNIELFSFLFWLTWNTKQQLKAKRMSEATYKLQKKFFLALVIQTVLPFAMLSIPVIIFVIMIQYGLQNQALINFGILVVTTHGPISTLVMILVHRPYRLAVKEMIMGRGTSKTVPKAVTRTLKFSVVSMS